MSPTTLDSLRPGQAATITALAASGVAAQRLQEMGLTEGEAVEVLAVAPLGDPLEIRIRGYQLSLRRSEARLIAVSLANEAADG